MSQPSPSKGVHTVISGLAQLFKTRSLVTKEKCVKTVSNKPVGIHSRKINDQIPLPPVSNSLPFSGSRATASSSILSFNENIQTEEAGYTFTEAQNHLPDSPPASQGTYHVQEANHSESLRDILFKENYDISHTSVPVENQDVLVKIPEYVSVPAKNVLVNIPEYVSVPAKYFPLIINPTETYLLPYQNNGQCVAIQLNVVQSLGEIIVAKVSGCSQLDSTTSFPEELILSLENEVKITEPAMPVPDPTAQVHI